MGYTASDLHALVADYARELSRHVRVERILLFGSQARGEAGQGSDIDLLVVSPDFGKDYLAEMTLLSRCLPRLEVDVDALPRTPEELSAAEPDSFLATILEDAVEVYPRCAR